MAQIREFESTTESYFILDGVSYPKVYEAMLDNGYSETRIKLVGTNRDTTPLVFSTEYTNILVDGEDFDTASEAISRLNQVVFSKGGGSGGGGTTGGAITYLESPVNIDNIKDSGIYKINRSFIDRDILFTDSNGNQLDVFNDLLSGYGSDSGSLLLSVLRTKTEEFSEEPDSDYVYQTLTVLNTQLPDSAEEAREFKRIIYVEEGAQAKDFIETTNRTTTSYSTEEIKTGGTWIDGKPLYKKTQLTSDPIPSNIETRLQDEIVGTYTVYHYTKTTD